MLGIRAIMREVAAIADPDELRRRKAELEAQAGRLRTEKEAEEERRRVARTEYFRLLAGFLNRAEELGILPERITPCMSGFGSGSILWVEGYRTPIGIVTQPPARYSVAQIRPMRRKLAGVVRQVEAVCLFNIDHPSDHHPQEERVSGPLLAPQFRDFDWIPESRWQSVMDSARERLEQTLVSLLT